MIAKTSQSASSLIRDSPRTATVAARTKSTTKNQCSYDMETELKIQAVLLPTSLLGLKGYEMGYANGYVGVPPGHTWFGKHYDNLDVEAHGGLTYSEDHCPRREPDGLWWVGFDVCHFNDNPVTCDKAYCEAALEKLRQQAIEDGR